MSQALQQARPERGRVGMTRDREDGPADPGCTRRTRPRAAGTGWSTGVIAWRQRPPRTPFRQRLVAWRARNWRRVVLAWFVLSMIIMVVAAEPKTDFPRAQVRSVPAVQMFLRVAGGLTVAGVPVLLIALP